MMMYDSAKVRQLQQFVAVLNGQPFCGSVNSRQLPSANRKPVAQPSTAAQPQPIQPVAPVAQNHIQPVEEVSAMTKLEPITAKFNNTEAKWKQNRKKKRAY